MTENLYEALKHCENNMIAFIGMAKNTGKTTALNQAVKEAQQAEKKLGILSYGRDGEAFDEMTNQQKPAIKIPADTYFVTADSRLEQKKNLCQFITSLQITTPLGEINLYKSKSNLLHPLEVELIGINRTSSLEQVRKLILSECDFVFVDGALDRKSSALPRLAEGLILSTGAVLGSSVGGIVEKTDRFLRILNLPALPPGRLSNYFLTKLNKSRDSLKGFFYWPDSDNITKLAADTSFELKDRLAKILEDEDFREKLQAGNSSLYLTLAGAFTSGLCDFILQHDELQGMTIVLKDPTRVFVQGEEIAKLEQNDINIKMLDSMQLLALTVNPHNPVGRDISSQKIRAELENNWPELPIFDVKASDYRI